MATKTISITEEAYDRLSSLRKDSESFSKIIERMTNKVDILDYAGILSEEEAARLEKSIYKTRKKSGLRMKEIREEFHK